MLHVHEIEFIACSYFCILLSLSKRLICLYTKEVSYIIKSVLLKCSHVPILILYMITGIFIMCP